MHRNDYPYRNPSLYENEVSKFCGTMLKSSLPWQLKSVGRRRNIKTENPQFCERIWDKNCIRSRVI